jgi:hypothetical protein
MLVNKLPLLNSRYALRNGIEKDLNARVIGLCDTREFQLATYFGLRAGVWCIVGTQKAPSLNALAPGYVDFRNLVVLPPETQMLLTATAPLRIGVLTYDGVPEQLQQQGGGQRQQ